MNRICNTCNIEIDENNYLKDITVCKICYNNFRGKIKNQQPKIDKTNINYDNNPNVSTDETHAYVVIGQRNVCKTFDLLKVLEKIGNKGPIHIITRLPINIQIIKQVMKLNH